MGFDQMCRGWIKGTKGFRKSILNDLKNKTMLRVTKSEAAEMREPRWERTIADLLARMVRIEVDLADSARKSPWKVAVARLLRKRYLVPNRWIAERLCMVQVSTVQSLVSRQRMKHWDDPNGTVLRGFSEIERTA